MKELYILIIFVMAAFLAGINVQKRFTDDTLGKEAHIKQSSPSSKGAGGLPRVTKTSAPTFDDLLDAIEYVESKGDSNAVGDWTQWKEVPMSPDDTLIVPSGEEAIIQFKNISGTNMWRKAAAVGAYQIHKIFVDDCNRIAELPGYIKFEDYTHNDRLDKDISRQMVWLYLKHYGGTFEEMARKHNGGPNGHLKESTKPYWLKVKARMEETK